MTRKPGNGSKRWSKPWSEAGSWLFQPGPHGTGGGPLHAEVPILPRLPSSRRLPGAGAEPRAPPARPGKEKNRPPPGGRRRGHPRWKRADSHRPAASLRSPRVALEISRRDTKSQEAREEGLKRIVRDELGIGIGVGSPLAAVKHAYTHFRITLTAFSCTLLEGSPAGPQWRWAGAGESEALPFSSADRRIARSVALRQVIDLPRFHVIL